MKSAYPVAALVLSASIASAQGVPPAGQDAGAPPAVQEEAPPHTRTGWTTLVKDSAGDFLAFPQRPSTWTLVGLGAAAALAARQADDHVARHIVGSSAAERAFVGGKWLGSAQIQIGTAAGLWAIGRYVVAPVADEARTNKVSELGFDLIRAQVLSQTLTHAIKVTVRRDRPTGECCSFSSGHSATAFAVASVLERHFGYRASWPALAAATYVAASRLVDDRHFLSDVAFGAGIGLASGWTVVGTRARGGRQLAVVPVPLEGGMMITLTRLP